MAYEVQLMLNFPCSQFSIVWAAIFTLNLISSAGFQHDRIVNGIQIKKRVIRFALDQRQNVETKCTLKRDIFRDSSCFDVINKSEY